MMYSEHLATCTSRCPEYDACVGSMNLRGKRTPNIMIPVRRQFLLALIKDNNKFLTTKGSFLTWNAFWSTCCQYQFARYHL